MSDVVFNNRGVIKGIIISVFFSLISFLFFDSFQLFANHLTDFIDYRMGINSRTAFREVFFIYSFLYAVLFFLSCLFLRYVRLFISIENFFMLMYMVFHVVGLLLIFNIYIYTHKNIKIYLVN